MTLFDLLYCISIIFLLPFWSKYIFSPEYHRILKRRLAPKIKHSNEKRIWIHAVSVGEAKSIKSLIDNINSGYKKKIVLSVSTPTGYEFAKKEYKNIEVISAPVDLSFIIKKFINRINPQILILNELELWPNWITIIHRKNIPILLINGRISDRAFRKYRICSFILKKFFNKIDSYLVQAKIYQQRFIKLHIPESRIKVCGNIKADEALKMSQNLPNNKIIFDFLKSENPHITVLTLASSHSSDEKIILPVITALKESISFIIVPRHPDRIKEIEKLFSKTKIKYAIWSKTKRINLKKEVLIFDKMGYLANILKISQIVFMGGTFQKKIGGHNLYEPAALGKLIIGGPHFNNFPDIGRELVERKTYKIMHNSEQMIKFLKNQPEIDLANINSRNIKPITKRKGSTECILKQIHYLIKS